MAVGSGSHSFTMQTYAVFTALLLLGGRRGSIAVAVYIALGAVGLPVFSGFAGGIGKLMGPSGGYIFGFMLTALCYWLCERVLGKKLWVRIVSLVVGLALCYAFGTVWFVKVYSAAKPTLCLGAGHVRFSVHRPGSCQNGACVSDRAGDKKTCEYRVKKAARPRTGCFCVKLRRSERQTGIYESLFI